MELAVCFSSLKGYQMKDGEIIQFDGLKIDGRRVKRKHDKETGLVSSVEGFSAQGDGAPEQVAREFVKLNYRLLAKRRSVVRDMEVEQVSRSPVGYHVVLKQTNEGVPVEDATVSVHMDQEKRVHAARNHLQPEAAKLDVQTMNQDSIDPQEAITIAKASVGVGDDLVEPPRVEQVVVAEEKPKLAWKVSFSTAGSQQDWIVFVGTEGGEVLESREISF